MQSFRVQQGHAAIKLTADENLAHSQIGTLHLLTQVLYDKERRAARKK